MSATLCVLSFVDSGLGRKTGKKGKTGGQDARGIRESKYRGVLWVMDVDRASISSVASVRRWVLGCVRCCLRALMIDGGINPRPLMMDGGINPLADEAQEYTSLGGCIPFRTGESPSIAEQRQWGSSIGLVARVPARACPVCAIVVVQFLLRCERVFRDSVSLPVSSLLRLCSMEYTAVGCNTCTDSSTSMQQVFGGSNT